MLRTPLLVSCFVAFELFIVPTNATALTYSGTPVAAGWAVDDGPTDGVFDSLHAPSSTDIAVILGEFTFESRGLMEFDLQGIPVNATIQSATLDLTTFGEQGTPEDVSILGYDADGTISLSDATANANLLDTFTVASGVGFASMDVTSFITASLGSSSHVGLRGEVVNNPIPSFAVTSLGARPGFFPGTEPLLTVDYLPIGTQVIADFVDDIQGPTPSPGWSYLRNESQPIGTSSSYLPLLWTGNEYDADGIPGTPGPGDNFAFLSEGGAAFGANGHPGLSTLFGAPNDEFVIAGYTLSDAGVVEITNSTLQTLNDLFPTNGVELRVYVNENLVSGSQQFVPGLSSTTFDQSLGLLSGGDTIYVAVGPNEDYSADSFFLDFSLEQTFGEADFDEDGDVDGFDFLTLQRGLGTDAGAGNMAPLAEGNANGDRFINSDDLVIWEAQYGTSGAPLSAANAVVPEPSCLALVLSCLLLASLRERHESCSGR